MTGLGVAVGIALVFAGVLLGAAVASWDRKQVLADLDQALGERDIARERIVMLEGERDRWRRECHRWWQSSRSWKRHAARLSEDQEVSA